MPPALPRAACHRPVSLPRAGGRSAEAAAARLVCVPGPRAQLALGCCGCGGLWLGRLQLPPWCERDVAPLKQLQFLGLLPWLGAPQGKWDAGGRASSLWHLQAALMPPVAQVLLEALYFSLVAKRLHPDEDDTLVESPAVTPVSERVPRVRPPHGFALFLAKEEARKVKRLHGMLRVSSVTGAQHLLSTCVLANMLASCRFSLHKKPHAYPLLPQRPYGPYPITPNSYPPQSLLSLHVRLRCLLCLASQGPRGGLHPQQGIGRCLCCLLGTKNLGHGQIAGRLYCGGRDLDWLTPGLSLPPEPAGVYALFAGDAVGQPRGCLMSQPCLPLTECHQAGAGQPGLPGHHPVWTP